MAMAWKTPRQYPGPSTRHRVASSNGATPLTKQATGTASEGRRYGSRTPMAPFISAPQMGAGMKYRDAVRDEAPRTSCRYKAVSCSLALRAPQTSNTVMQMAVKGTFAHNVLGISAGRP